MMAAWDREETTMAEEGESCIQCRFYQSNTGNCRRRAPLVTGGMMSSVETVWPTTDIHDWCGEFEDLPENYDPPSSSKPAVRQCELCEDGVKIVEWDDAGCCPKCGLDLLPF
jgi:hypothetical protein